MYVQKNQNQNKANTTFRKTVSIKKTQKITNRYLTWRAELRGKARYFPPEGKQESGSDLLVPEEREVDLPLSLWP